MINSIERVLSLRRFAADVAGDFRRTGDCSWRSLEAKVMFEPSGSSVGKPVGDSYAMGWFQILEFCVRQPMGYEASF